MIKSGNGAFSRNTSDAPNFPVNGDVVFDSPNATILYIDDTTSAIDHSSGAAAKPSTEYPTIIPDATAEPNVDGHTPSASATTAGTNHDNPHTGLLLRNKHMGRAHHHQQQQPTTNVNE